MRRLTLSIPDAVADQLSEMAARELREPKAEATLLLVAAVERASRKASRRPAATAPSGRPEQ